MRNDLGSKAQFPQGETHKTLVSYQIMDLVGAGKREESFCPRRDKLVYADK